MEKMNGLFVELNNNEIYKNENIIKQINDLDKEIEIIHLENGIFLNKKTQIIKEDKEDLKKYYESGTPTFYKDLLKFFNNKHKFYELYKISNGVSHFKSNLLRYATMNLFEKNGFLKETYNYTNYERYRCPIEYTLFQIAPDSEFIEGVTEGVFYLQLTNSENSRVVVEQYESWTGALILNAYSPDREVIKEMYKLLFSWMNDNNYLKSKKINAYGKFLKLENTTWDDIVLDVNLEKMLKKHLIDYIQKFDTLKEKNLPTSRGFLLHGPPGTGKSMLGKVLANQTNCSFIWVPYSAEENILYNDIFNLAREISPTIVFMEDLASQGGMDRRGGVTHAALGTILNLLSGIESNAGVITFATENYIENLDVALRNRPGRFDYILELGNPNKEHRLKLLTKFLSEYTIHRLIHLAEMTENFSCAHLRELVNRLIIEDDSPENDDVIITDMIKTFGIVQ